MPRKSMLNVTHDPNRKSWEHSANEEGCEFPIQNLPFGRFRTSSGEDAPRSGVAIGNKIFDLKAALEAKLFSGGAMKAGEAASDETLAPLFALDIESVSELRAQVSDLLREGGPEDARCISDSLLIPMAEAKMMLPTPVRQFTDMCISTFHIGRQSGNDSHGQPIVPPVMRWQPVGYDARASSVVVSGTHVRRPRGIRLQAPGDTQPSYGPEPRQDYEMEMGIWFGGASNPLGSPIAITDAGNSIFGLCLLNDWSSRGIQMWETMLGPFLGKSVATTVSPWVITTEALAPFRCEAFRRPPEDPQGLPHLRTPEDQLQGGFDVAMHASIKTARMHQQSSVPFEICATNFRYMYWTAAQLIAHHTSNGCSLAAGDLIGSGTCSGPEASQAACLWEKSLAGEWQLPNGEKRLWLEDGDEITLSARAQREGFVSIGFGTATGIVDPCV
jgi:fumarylacetoacetase